MNILDIATCAVDAIFLVAVALFLVFLGDAILGELRDLRNGKPMAPWVQPGRKRGRR